MINPTNIFIPTAGGPTVVASTVKGTAVDNALSAANRFRDLVTGFDNNAIRNGLSDNEAIESGGYNQENAGNFKSNTHTEYKLSGIDLPYSNVEIPRNLEDALSTNFIVDKKAKVNTPDKHDFRLPKNVSQAEVGQYAFDLPEAKITDDIAIPDMQKLPNSATVQSEHVATPILRLPVTSSSSMLSQRLVSHHILQPSPVKANVILDSIVEGRSEAPTFHSIPIDKGSRILTSHIDIKGFTVNQDLPLPQPTISMVDEYAPNKSTLDKGESEPFKGTLDVIIKAALPTDSGIVRVTELPSLVTTTILPANRVTQTMQVESLVYLTWFATGELSFTGKEYLSSATKDTTLPHTASFITLDTATSGAITKPISYNKRSASSQVNAVVVGHSVSRNDTSIEKVVSPGDLSSFIALRFPEFAKRKLTVVNNDGAVDVVIRDYDVSDTEVKEISRCINTHFSASGKTLRSLTLNGTRVH